MQGTLIYISSLQHNDIADEFDNVLKKEKYACFPVMNMENISSELWLLAVPFNKQIHWFFAQETSRNDVEAILAIIDKHVLTDTPTDKIISLPLRKKGMLDNTEYSFSADTDRNDSALKIIDAIRKNTMGDYNFCQHCDNVFKITPRKSRAEF